MIKIENVEVTGWKPAIRGMRNPMNSWDLSDTVYGTYWGEIDGHKCFDNNGFVIGDNDLKLMQLLARKGSVHGKYLRMINVTCDITAPLYWWKEFDTYKIGTVSNSCSTMHKIHAKEFTWGDFSTEHIGNVPNCGPEYDILMEHIIDTLNEARHCYLDTNDKKYWWQMIQLLPSSYNQKRTIQLNYEVLRNICTDRSNHKLDEWVAFCKWAKTLPYFNEIFGNDNIYENKYTVLKTEEYEEMLELINKLKESKKV